MIHVPLPVPGTTVYVCGFPAPHLNRSKCILGNRPTTLSAAGHNTPIDVLLVPGPTIFKLSGSYLSFRSRDEPPKLRNQLPSFPPGRLASKIDKRLYLADMVEQKRVPFLDHACLRPVAAVCCSAGVVAVVALGSRLVHRRRLQGCVRGREEFRAVRYSFISLSSW